MAMNNARGWKTITAGICTILYGASATLVGFVLEPNPEWALSANAGLLVILSGLGMLGLGGKLTKLIEALQGKK